MLGMFTATENNIVLSALCQTAARLKFTEHICEVLFRMSKVHFIKQNHHHLLFVLIVVAHLIKSLYKFGCFESSFDRVIVTKQGSRAVPIGLNRNRQEIHATMDSIVFGKL